MSGWRSKPFAWADCMDCGARGVPEHPDRPLNQAAWARAHVRANPDHTCHVVTEQTTVIKA